MYFHIRHFRDGKFPFATEVIVMFLFLPMFLLPFLSVCISVWRLLPVVRIRTQSCLKSSKSCRWVIVWLILCSVSSVVMEQQTFLIINTPLVHQGSRIDEQRCEFPLPLKVSLQSENVYTGLIPCVCWHRPVYERHDICFPKQQKRQALIIIRCSFVSILVSAFDDRWRPAAHPPFKVGGLLDRPPSGEACRCESHLVPLWPRYRELRHHGERWRGQNLPRVLPLTSK